MSGMMSRRRSVAAKTKKKLLAEQKVIEHTMALEAKKERISKRKQQYEKED